MKRNRTLRILAVSLLLLVAGCGTTSEPEGIYYPALSHNFLKDSYALVSGQSGCYADVAWMYYNGEVYSRSHAYREYSKSSLPLDTLLGNELCTVYGIERLYWSDNKEDLAACTHTGTLYLVPGFEEEFRVCLYFEEPANVANGIGPTYSLYVFDRTNNITLHKGKDYYTNLYHFPTDASLDDSGISEDTRNAFAKALLAAEFIDPSTKDLPVFDFSTDKTYYFRFTDSLGLSNSVAIFEDGYVVDNEDHNFILKLDPVLCRSVIDQLHQPEWSGKYKYVTYTYDKDRSIRTEYNYQLIVTEDDTNLNFDLCVTRTDTPINPSGTPIDVLAITGPVVNFSVSKQDTVQKHTISFTSQRFPDTAPELIEYIELKKGLQEDIISLRYAASEEELAEKEFVVLHKQ